MNINKRKSSSEEDRKYAKPPMGQEDRNLLHANKPLEDDIAKNGKMYFFALFFIGVINNTGYVLVGTAAQDIAKKFDMDNFMPLFSLSLIMLSGVTRSINSKYFIKVPHKKRIFVAICLAILAFGIIAISSMTSNKWGFYTSLLGSIICGAMCSFGESVMLGFIKVFPPKLVGGWSSGTGFAGPFGSGLLLIFKAVDIELYLIFFIMIPIQASYWLWFLWYESKKRQFIDNRATSDAESIQQSVESSVDEHQDLGQQDEGSEGVTSDAKNNKKLSWQNIQLVLPKMWTLAINLGSVYFLEYVIETGWAERAHPKKDDSQYPNGFEGFLEKNGFVILCFCYQIGVFISRSSLYLIRVEKVLIFTLCQIGNFVLWIFFAVDKSVLMTIQIPCMIFVGLMGGGSYVNVNYSLLNHKGIDKTEKELAMNICSIFNDTGVLLSALVVLVIDNFIIQNSEYQ